MDQKNNIDNIDNIKKLSEIYKKLGYFEQYGGSVFLFIVITIIVFVIYSYFFTLSNIQPIKDDWVNNRCNPKYMPFAGIINKPDDMSASEYTKQNFDHCVQNILEDVTGGALEPITYTTDVLQKFFDQISEGVNNLRDMISNVRNSVQNVGQELMGRILNMLTPLQQILIMFVDVMYKTQGILTAGLYTSMGTYNTLQSLLGAIVELIVLILLILLAIILGLWIVPFSWPAAATMSVVFLSISIPMTLIVLFMTEVLHVKTSGVPALRCFDKNTEIKMRNGKYKKIKNISVGDELYNKNDYVTSKMKLSTAYVNMYNYNNIIVSGTHKIKYKNNWITISEHPKAIKIEKYHEPHIYCINTLSKQIIINDSIFCDWDETITELEKINNQYLYNLHLTNCKNKEVLDYIIEKRYTVVNVNNVKDNILHYCFDSGFDKNTIIKMKNNTQKTINNINIGDVLEDDSVVYGVVEIHGESLINQYEYTLDNKIKFIGGPNINIKNNNLDNLYSTLHLDRKKCKIIKSKQNLFHLLTNKNSFKINNICFFDYNSSIDLFLNDDRRKLLYYNYV